jgi:uncharacterized membrane protein YhaH (DUF805 family)
MELTITDFVLFVVFGACLLVPLFSVVSRTLHARSEARSLAARFICRLCLHAYQDFGPTKVVACPRCGAANERGCDPRKS